MKLLTIFALSFFSSLVLTYISIFLSKRFNILDYPINERKIHKKPIPLLGGFGVFFALLFVYYLNFESLIVGDLAAKHWVGVFVGASFLLIGGILDDKYNLKPKQQIIAPFFAVVSVIVGGVGINEITNPLGGVFVLTSFISSFVIFVWLLGMTYTTKLLDGLDGLVTGVVAIGSFIIFLFTLSDKYYQYDIAVASLMLFGVCLGFLVFNWHPAKIFLGESGSLLLGFLLGVLSIISGAKIAISLLVLALPIMDVAWTIIRRLKKGRNPFKFSDKKHLHHRLLALGLGHRRTAIFYYFVAGISGLLALFLQSIGKIFALILLVLVMVFIVITFNNRDKNIDKG